MGKYKLQLFELMLLVGIVFCMTAGESDCRSRIGIACAEVYAFINLVLGILFFMRKRYVHAATRILVMCLLLEILYIAASRLATIYENRMYFDPQLQKKNEEWQVLM